ncbi:MAG: helix-turn-helix domain-containing protein [Lentisphaeria bacterium]|nr:helix-turn-helix domain-containing protein [Lentisphaeria bacterium]
MTKYNNFFKSKEWTFGADPGFPLRVKLEDPQEETHLHQHEFCECVFVVRGHGKHHSENHPPVTARRGCVIVIPVGGHHAYTAVSPDFAVFNLLFDTSQLPPVLLELYSHPSYKQIFLRDHTAYGEQDFPMTRLEDKVFRKLESLLEYLAEMDGTPGNHCYKLGLFMAVLSRLCSEWKIRQDSLAVPLDIPKLTAYLEQHFQQEIYLDDLAKRAGMSSATLLRHFRAALGVTPMVYLRNLRLRHAAELLLGTDFSLKEIADRSGFSWMPYFFKSFKECYGVPPLEYRRNSADDPPRNIRKRSRRQK